VGGEAGRLRARLRGEPGAVQDKVIVNGDHDGDSYLVALDKNSGRELWRVDREHKTRSYVTPIIREIDGRTQMLMSGSKSVTSYDPRTGELHWRMDGPTEQFVASLVFNGDYFSDVPSHRARDGHQARWQGSPDRAWHHQMSVVRASQ
jgi:outer membrane protein assembly factor BamB